MADSFIQLPDDSANTGKKVRAITRTVGGDTVNEHVQRITDPVNDIQAGVSDVLPGAGDAGILTREIPTNPENSNLSNVAATTSSTMLLAANNFRVGIFIVNDPAVGGPAADTLLVKLGTTASATSFTLKLGSGDTYDEQVRPFTGQIDGIWSGTNGTARITELTL